MSDHLTMLEELAILLWHRFAPDDRIEWEDETHKSEYRDVAEAAIALMRAPVAYARDCPAQFFASGPDACFFTDSAQFAEDTILAHDYDRDDWTVTDLYAAMRQMGE